MNAEEDHCAMTIACLAFWKRCVDDWDSDIREWSPGFTLRKHKGHRPILRYVIYHWVEHARLSGSHFRNVTHAVPGTFEPESMLLMTWLDASKKIRNSSQHEVVRRSGFGEL